MVPEIDLASASRLRPELKREDGSSGKTKSHRKSQRGSLSRDCPPFTGDTMKDKMIAALIVLGFLGWLFCAWCASA
jgi:hypothetical protein